MLVRTGVLVLILNLQAIVVRGEEGYAARVEQWRQGQESKLKSESGWLTLVGLHWLRPGVMLIGSDPTCDVVLPSSAPPQVGDLTVKDGRATLQLVPGVAITRNGQPFSGGEVHTDAGGKADELALGALRLLVLKRGERYALRVKDNASRLRATFAGLKWYPVDASWRIRGRFEPSTTPMRLVLDTIVGEQESFESPGHVVFERDGKVYWLQAAREGNHLWFVFRDGTSGRTTHAGARSLLSDLPDATGQVVLDFNKAVNLPCAYTPYATCPLAPRQNRLGLAITAGERLYDPSSAPAAKAPPGAAR